MIKDFFVKKMLESQLKGVPEDQKEKIIGMVSKNPEFFKKLAEDVKKEMDSGKDQFAAVMAVLPKYQDELKKMM